MKEHKGMYKKSGLITRETTREQSLHGKLGAGFNKATRADDIDKGINKSTFSPGTKARLNHELKDSMKKSVRPLPKQGDDLDGQLNNDHRSDYNVPEKMARIDHNQGRNNEWLKTGKPGNESGMPQNNSADDLGGGISTKRAGIGKPTISNK